MGVVHKLSQEVINFIVQHKKDNPSLSCRQLSDLIAEKFQKDVSKSSVNSILKKSGLSSEVGRRAKSGRSKRKFAIPEERKKQLFTENPPSLEAPLPAERPDVALKEEELKKKIEQFVEQKPAVDKTEQPIPAQEEEVPEETPEAAEDKAHMPLLPDPLAEQKEREEEIVQEEKIAPVREPQAQESPFERDVAAARSRREESKGKIYSGAELIFLLAPIWSVLDNGRFIKTVLEYARGGLPQNFAQACDVLLLLLALGTDEAKKTLNDKRQLLRRLTDFEVNEDFTTLWAKYTSISLSEEQTYALVTEIDQSFSAVNQIKITLENGAPIYLTADLGRLYAESERIVSSMLTTAHLQQLTSRLISNNEPVALYDWPEEGEGAERFFDFVAMCENLPHKMVRSVTCYGPEGLEIARFSAVPVQRRIFMAAVASEQKRFAELSKAIKWAGKSPFYFSALDRVVYFTDTRTDHFARNVHESLKEFRVLTVWSRPDEEPLGAIVTNDIKTPGAQCLLNYLSCRSGFLNRQTFVTRELAEAYGEDKSSPLSANFTGRNTLGAIMEYFATRINAYVVSNFYKTGTISITCSNISCYICELSGQLQVVFSGPGGEGKRKLVNLLSSTINNMAIKDRKSRNLFILSDF